MGRNPRHPIPAGCETRKCKSFGMKPRVWARVAGLQSRMMRSVITVTLLTAGKVWHLGGRCNRVHSCKHSSRLPVRIRLCPPPAALAGVNLLSNLESRARKSGSVAGPHLPAPPSAPTQFWLGNIRFCISAGRESCVNGKHPGSIPGRAASVRPPVPSAGTCDIFH